jgi:large subunit ribosomal protein L9
LGYIGDSVTVRRGFARNFLIPRGIAVEVSSKNARALAHRMEHINALKARKKKEAETYGKDIAGLVVEFHLKLGSGGKVFGSVTTKDIEAALRARGFPIDKKQIKLSEPIKLPGDHRVQVKLHSEVTAPITVSVVADKASKALSQAVAEQTETPAKEAEVAAE